MPDMERERKIAAAKRKLKKFKQRRGNDLKIQVTTDDTSSLASEETIDENVTGDLINANTKNADRLFQENSLKDSTPEKIITTNSSEETRDEHLSGDLENANDGNSDQFLAESSLMHSVAEQDSPPISANIDFTTKYRNGFNETESSELATSLNNVNELRTVAENSVSKPPEHSSTTGKLPKNDNLSKTYANTDNLNPEIEEVEESFLHVSELRESAIKTNTHIEEVEKDAAQNNDHCELSADEAEISTATTEKLLQISTKLNGLAAEAQSLENGSSFTSADKFVLTELENRNQQLAEQVSLLTRQKQDLMVQLDQLRQQTKELHHRLETEKQQIYTHGVNEQSTLRQQLQVQMQTISILVAEKQELQHQIHEARSTLNLEQTSRQKYQDQLQNSKLRVQTLERELKSNIDSVSELTDLKLKLSEERDQLQAKLQKVTRSNEENSMHAGELSQKLSNKEDECKRLEIELVDLHEKLSMAEVLLQQLSSTSGASADNQLKKIQEERESLNQKLIEYQQAFEQLTTEREQLSRQYEDVNQQMQKQVNNLSQQVTLLENEKTELQNEVEELQGALKIMEEKNQQNADEDKTESKDENVEKDLRVKLEQSSNDLAQVLAERDDVINQLNAQLRNNERLAKLNEEQELQLNELNRNISDTVASAEEHTKLLEQSQNDKTTISRALMQNKQLKQQLEEMQEGFIKLSNDKMELATQLTTTEHARKELEDEIRKHQVSLSLVEDELSAKDKTVNELQNALLQAEVSNRDQEISQQPNVAPDENLRVELIASQETVSILGEQNNQLKTMVTTLQQQLDDAQQRSYPSTARSAESSALTDVSDSLSTASSGSFDDDEKEQDTVSLLSTSVQQLEQEKEDLARRFEEEQREHAVLLEQYQDLKETYEKAGKVLPEEHQQLIGNMELLQNRFTKVMKERVDALNKVEELEHVNMQLQNECDTIGEYITLYHNQRQILKQRHHEKDEYVSAMAQEREQMQLKLEKLQTLVLTLLNNRGANTPPPSHSSVSSTPVKIHDKPQGVETNATSEWSSLLEDEESKAVQISRPDLLPDPATLRSHRDAALKNPDSENGEEIQKPDHYPGKLERVEDVPSDVEETTATEIFSLLEQMQNPSKSASVEVPQGFCLRYMGPYTAI